MKSYLLTTAALLLSRISAYQCPDLSCDEPIGGTICFLHPGGSPVEGTIRTFKCPRNQYCGIQEGRYAWVEASKNSLNDSPNRGDSAVYKKILQKECEIIDVFQ